jgi:lysophospholipase L1-like esterase
MWSMLMVAGLGLAAEAKLQEGDSVAVIGDSITEQRLYTMFIEDYLLMCQPAPKLRAMQFGWGGETAGGFRGRMANDCLPFKPTIATTCYGMNDGGYRPFKENEQGKSYRENQKAIVEGFKKAGLRMIVVGSPGAVDFNTFRGGNAEMAAMYNETLGKLRDIAREVAQEQGVLFANVHDAMMEAMKKAEAKLGKTYNVCGGDGFHPGPNGHLVMAYAFLKAMGCDGAIGTITVDLADGKATATDGHKVLSCQGGTVEIESSRYPFCFFGDPKSPGSTSGIIEFFPFNEDLNRFTLVVKGAKAARLRVTWGKTSKEFDAAALEKGINLAAEFIENPFCGQFQKVEQLVRAQQNFETPAIKEIINKLPSLRNALAGKEEALERVRASVTQLDKDLSDLAASAVAPVRHTLKIEPLIDASR